MKYFRNTVFSQRPHCFFQTNTKVFSLIKYQLNHSNLLTFCYGKLTMYLKEVKREVFWVDPSLVCIIKHIFHAHHVYVPDIEVSLFTFGSFSQT